MSCSLIKTHGTLRQHARTVAQRSSDDVFSEELQLGLRMSTLVSILSFDNQ